MGFIPLPLQSGQYMVETWQVVALAAGILVTVLTVYGALIKTNYDGITLLKQRLLGTDEDESDDGFLVQTSHKLDCLSDKMDSHHEDVQNGLMENRRRVEMMENRVERVEYKIDAVQEVVSDEHDILFRGGSDTRQADGGQARENTRVAGGRDESENEREPREES